MLGTVSHVPINPDFVGRRVELAELMHAAEAADHGRPQALLIRGEAGVGKTRLVEELLRTLDPERSIAAIGCCTQLGGHGFPFAPFSAVLRVLWRRLPDEVRAASAGQESLLARILPELDAPTSVERRDDDQARLFELTTRILERLASNRLIVIVIEDLHWADASTRSLMTYLLHSRGSARLLIVGTFRSDEIHRQHPLRPLMAEVDRDRTVHQVALSRFDRVEVTKQLDGLLGAPPEPAILNDVFLRSDGNAFFVEELARAYRDRAGEGLDNLRDLLLARLEALPETSQRIVRMAAESSTVIGYQLLKAVAGLPENELIEGLRGAVLAQILVPAPHDSGYQFRHSLVREAVSESLLPGERALINREYGEALEADTSLVQPEELAGLLAQHWYAAHDEAKALCMTVPAADQAWARCAYAERLRLLGRALELWDRVSEDVRGALPALRLPPVYPRRGYTGGGVGPGRLDLLAAATTAAWHSGDLDRSLHLARLALELLSAESEQDQVRAAWFWTRCSLLVQALNRGDGWRELQTARELVATLPPSVVHADVLVHIANWSVRHLPASETRVAADQAVEYAVRLGAEDLELDARITRCWIDAETDLDGTSLADLYEVRERAERLGVVDIIGRVNQNLPSVLEGMGRSEEAIVAAEYGVAKCRSLGLADTEAWVHLNRSFSLSSLGRWEESEAALDEAAAVGQSHKLRAAIAARRAYGVLMRGDVTTAGNQMAAACDLFVGDFQPQFFVSLSHYTMEIAARQGRLADARAEFLRADAEHLTTGPIRYSLPMLCTAAAIEADASQSGAGEISTDVLAAVRRAADRLNVVFPISHAFAHLLQAELRRAEGEDDPDRWSAAVAAFEPLNRPNELAVALLGEGRALLATSRHDAAIDRLTSAHRIATTLGAKLILDDLKPLLTRAGAATTLGTDTAQVDESGPSPASADERNTGTGAEVPYFGLTPREAEVLKLVAQGHSNRRIAEELYISQKTTSTHVSNILAKLGASSRTEAAAITHRLGLTAPE